MKVLGLTNAFSGCGYHRIMLPVSLMAKEKGRITDTIDDETLKEGFDIVYVNRMWDKADLFALREKWGFKLVVDLDDYWILDHDHINYDHYSQSNFDMKVIQHIKAADLVTCTHDRLAERISPYNKNVIVLPNAIPYGEMQFHEYKDPFDKVRFFWAGGISHEQDLKLVRRPMSKMGHLKDQIQMIIGGYSDGNQHEKMVWQNMADSLSGNKLLDIVALKSLPVFEYYSMWKRADVMMIPLRRSNFNIYKSNLKILEAAGKGIPVIVSSTHPYMGFPEDLVNYAGDDSMWMHWVDKMANDEKFRDEQGAALKEYCKTHYNFTEINTRRKEAFESLLVSE